MPKLCPNCAQLFLTHSFVLKIHDFDPAICEVVGLSETVRGSEKYLLVGIDVAKNKHYAFFGTPSGRTLRKNMIFDNSIRRV